MNESLWADMVLLNGVIYAADEADTVAEAVAIQGNRIAFVGSTEAVQLYIGKATQVIDLAGKFVIPGMSDTHLHPPGLSLLDLYEVQLYGRDSIAGYVAAVKEFMAGHPDMTLIYGRGWSWGILEGEELTRGPRKEYLDEISRDIPIILRAHDGHTLWVNSKALELNGITEQTTVPEGGVIEFDPLSGALWGILKESAMRLIRLPSYTLKQYRAAFSAFQKKMHSLGITSVLCLSSQVFEILFEACLALEEAGELSLHIRGAATIRPEEALAKQLAEIKLWQQKFTTRYLGVTTAKFFTDGVVEGGTSYLLSPYCRDMGKGKENYGTFLWDEAQLAQAFYEVNKRGLQIHVHSTGDGSTHLVLNALEKAQGRLPEQNYRNTITHLQLVAKEDIKRFKELNVIASVQPYWHFKGPNWWEKVDYQLLGARAENEFPLQSFFTAGVTVASSSDYPATIVPNPLLAIDIGVTRNMDNGNFHGVADILDGDDERYLLNCHERATVGQMIRSFTMNGAYLLFMEEDIGSIEAGKLADFAVLDQNLFTINPSDIDKVHVVMTLFGGKIVYER